MEKVFNFLGVENYDVITPPSKSDKFHLIGNKMLHVFDGKIRLDTTWKERLSLKDQKRMLELTSPLSSEMGYV